MTKKQKKQAAAASVLLLLLLAWKLASGKSKPKGIVTIGPITVEDTARDRYDDARERRALLRNKALDLIAFDEDAWTGTRKPSLADDLALTSIFAELAQLRRTIPDSDEYDAGFDADLEELVGAARTLSPATTSAVPPKAFGSSRWMTRRLNIEEEVRDLVAMGKARQIRRRPAPAELAVIHSMIAEHRALRDKLLELDPDLESEMFDEPLEEILMTALGLPATSTALAPVSEFVPGSLPVA